QIGAAGLKVKAFVTYGSVSLPTVSATITTTVAATIAATITTTVAATITTTVAATITITAVIAGRGRWRITGGTSRTAGIHPIALFAANGEVIKATVIATSATTIRRTCADHRRARRTLRSPIRFAANGPTSISTIKTTAI
ncbi:hypothetical protein VDQ54_23310, partial [Xanthomonas campestris pv. campestris]|nr:hypothetical protein [Xanthomonas campestris pv. campestris]